MSKTALILGARGQDGRLLTQHLSRQGYRVLGVGRTDIDCLDVAWDQAIDITSKHEVFDLVRKLQPDEVYHLAVIHQSAEAARALDLDFIRASYEVNFFSLLHFLEAIRLFSVRSRLFYAASSHVFGASPGEGPPLVQNEQTPLLPESVYAMTKVDGLLACRQYRAVHGVFASVGILFNHESSLRAPSFLTKRVVTAAVDIAHGAPGPLVLGDLDAEVDWGFAPDYVEAMQLTLQQAAGDEYVFATGCAHTVSQLVAAAFHEVGIDDWRAKVEQNAQNLVRRRRSCIGDPTKLTRITGWRPRTSFREMVASLVRDELASRRSGGA